jgi:hypothetical protein
VGIAPIFGPDDANRFTNQRLADEDQLARLFDLASAAHSADDDDASVPRIVEASDWGRAAAMHPPHLPGRRNAHSRSGGAAR